jgi:5,10-methylenetetrahydromethanopterin reductase
MTTKIGIGLPGISIKEAEASAEVVAAYDFDSFSVYGDLGDLPPYAVLHACAESLKDSNIAKIGPMGVPIGLFHPEATASNAIRLERELPNKSYIGLVRGAFLEQIGEEPAPLKMMAEVVDLLHERFLGEDISPSIYFGGFGPHLLKLAGTLGIEGVKLGGSVNVALAKKARETIANNEVKIVLGAVSVIDNDRKAARQAARQEVAKYLSVVGALDHTLDGDELASLIQFNELFSSGVTEAHKAISDSLLDKFAVAGSPEDALTMLSSLNGVVDRFEFGTPHGLRGRPESIGYIGETILNEFGD